MDVPGNLRLRHTTMAGMDPVKLTRDYTSRIIEYHMKDVLPEHKGGYKGRLQWPSEEINSSPSSAVSRGQ
jgi:sugar phosphate isomerase/epimerase